MLFGHDYSTPNLMLKFLKITFFFLHSLNNSWCRKLLGHGCSKPSSYSIFCVYHFFLHLLNNFWHLKLLSHGCSKLDSIFECFFFLNYFFLLCIRRITLDTKTCSAMALPNLTSCLIFDF